MTAKYLCRYCAEPIELHQGYEDIPTLGSVHSTCARQREFAESVPDATYTQTELDAADKRANERHDKLRIE